MRLPRRGHLFQAFFPAHSRSISQTLPAPGANGSPYVHSSGVLFFIFFLVFRQEPAQKPLCHSGGNGSGCPGHWDGKFSLLCPSLQRCCPCSARGFCLNPPPLRPQVRLSLLGMDAHLHFLQHLKELRRLKDTKRGEKGGVSARRSAEKTASPPSKSFLSPGLSQRQNVFGSREKII